MELKGSINIPASPEKVWQALNDSEVLRQCIPGCEDVQQISNEEMHARVLLRMGPVRARFAGKVKMTDIRPLQSYTLNFEGSGGSAGFAKGSSVVVLTAVEGGTQLTYTAQASVAGKLGQIGGRLMDASAGQLADKFFNNFKAFLSDNLSSDSSKHNTSNNEVQRNSLVTDAVMPVAEHWVEREVPRLLWFLAGVLSTSFGVWMGAHWLR